MTAAHVSDNAEERRARARAAWIEAAAAELTGANPEIRAEVLALLPDEEDEEEEVLDAD